MKRMTAKEILAGSLRELAAHTPVDKITIQEIVDNCGYSPATFYRQFRDKYDLIAWDYCQSLGTIMNQIGKNGYVWKQTLLEGMRYFGSQREYICNLLRHTSGHDSFLMHMAAKHIEMLSKEVLRK
ncbi:MAG: TetR family transcriptional regulator, partial [Clostridia bacterium]|nr:TetR family transcriptional regulator [Clostridia bacterium]